jgi:signal transduction histidine kinase
LRDALVFIVAILLGSSIAARADEPPRRVLILHSFNYTFPATSLVSEALRKRLLERVPKGLELEAEFLDLARIPGPEHALRMANLLREKYATMPLDVVVAIGPAAASFIVEHRDAVGPNVSVVISDITRATFEAMNLPPGVIGAIGEYYFDETLDLAARLQPNARRLIVIGGSDGVDRRWLEKARKAIEARGTKLEAEYWHDLSYDQLLAEVARLPSDAIVLVLTFFADSQGKRLIPRNVATAVARASAAPAYSLFETYLGSGIVGGYIDTFQSIGTHTADVVLQILSGTSVARIPPRADAEPAFRVDARAMARWDLKQSNLPPGSVVLFHEPSIWEQHRLLISVTAFIVGLQSLILASLLFQRRRRRQAENSLRESEERMTFTAASANVGLWQFNRATDELWATQHCRVLLGLADETPFSRDTFLAAVHPEDRRIAVRALRGISNEGGSALTDVRIIHPGGRERWIRVRARSHPDEGGLSDQLTGIFVDITDQKIAETEAELQRQEVTHLMRVSALGELSGAIAHEVNQPLTAILSNAQAALYLLEQDSPNLAEVRDALQDIVQEDNRAGEVVRRLRGLLKKGEARSEPVDVNELINLTIALLNSELIRRRVTVQTDLTDQLPALSGDPVQLQQVLLNLMMNAMDAMESTPVAARRVTISTRLSKTRRIEVRVRDRGPGLIPAKGNKLFEAFYTTKDHGLGLGLTICSTIVQAHGGEISLANDEAGGAVAGFSVPAQETLMAAQ